MAVVRKEDSSLLPPLNSNTNKQVRARGALGQVTETSSDFEPSTQISLLNASNDFLNQEIALLETERDRLQLELNQIRQSYGWKVIDGYRRWLARMRDRHPSFSKVYESITVW